MCCYTGHVRVGYIFSLHLHQDSASLCSINAIKISVVRWHSRLCHPSQDIIHRVVSKNNLPCAIFDNSIQSVCDACACTKSHQLPCLVSSSRSSSPLEHSFSDVWGPAIESFGCKKYYASFIDDYSQFTWTYLLHHKSDVFTYFLEFQSLVDQLFNKKVLVVHSDWGGEYDPLNSLFHKLGISHQVSCPDNRQQNDAAE
jgi:hypothetical protein